MATPPAQAPAQNRRRRMSFALLGSKIQKQILSYLDVHTIKDVLVASRYMRTKAVVIRVIADAGDKRPPFFFNVPHVKTMTLPNFDKWGMRKDQSPLQLFQRLQLDWISSNYMIRCFEVISTARFTDLAFEGDMSGLFVGMDSERSFVAVHRNIKEIDLDSTDLMEPLFAQLKNAKVAFIGSNNTRVKYPTPPTFDPKNEKRSRSPYANKVLKQLQENTRINRRLRVRYRLGFPPGDRYGNLKTLEITGIHSFTNYTIPNLVSLTLRFLRPKENDIRGLSLVESLDIPKLKYFAVHYSGEMPFFKDNKLGNMATKDEHYKSGIFELCHTSGFDLHGAPVLNSTTRLETYDGAELKFTKYFNYLTLVGVPEIVFRMMDLTQTLEIYWMRTIAYTEMYQHVLGREEVLRCPHLTDFHMETNLALSFAPCFGGLPNLENISVFTNARSFNMNGLLEKAGDCLKNIRVVCDLVPKEIGYDGHITLSELNLGKIFGGRSLQSVKIEGCYFGPDNGLLNQKHPIALHPQARVNEIALKFVRARDTPDEHRLDKIVMEFASRSFVTQLSTLKISQIHGPEEKAWNMFKVMLRLPPSSGDWTDDFCFVVSSDFKKVNVNNIRLNPLQEEDYIYENERETRERLCGNQWRFSSESGSWVPVDLERKLFLDIC